jgi:hypothetical protein
VSRSLLIGGQLRSLNHAPSGRRVAAVKPAVDLAALPETATIDSVPLDRDQGQLGSCGPNSLDEMYASRLGGNWSRLFAYYFTRSIENDTADDDGVTIPDLIDVASTMGMPPELVWPYDVSRYRDAPPSISLVAALPNRVTAQDAIADLDHLLFELANGQPVILGFGVPASMEDGGSGTEHSGIVELPGPGGPVGGHCVLAFGYDRRRQMVKTTSHYGKAYGDGGALWLPFAHWQGNVSDMRAIRRIGTT